jgi:phosphoserine phosphatase RsbU/P
MRRSKPVENVRVLVGEDHGATRDTLAFLLQRHGFDVTLAGDGLTAHEILSDPNGPSLALLDWMLPGMTGIDVCRKLNHELSGRLIYFIIITARDSREDLEQAFEAGADDFIRKPCDATELLARIRSGQRVIELEHRLSARVKECEIALDNVRQLQRLLPICMYCKKVRDDSQYWQEIDEYIHVHTGTDFSHGICPACMSDLEVGRAHGVGT